MLGISYGELFLIIGAAAALIGPKDLPVLARTLGRLAGRSIGYVQLARGQFENVMQQSQARQVHKELQDTMAQLEAIRHEIRTISFINPGPMTRRLVDNLDQTSVSNDVLGNSEPEKLNEDNIVTTTNSISDKLNQDNMVTTTNSKSEKLSEDNRLPATSSKDSSTTPGSSNMHSQATAYARLAESSGLNSGSMDSKEMLRELTDESGVTILPVSAESTGLLPDRRDDPKGSDIVLEAILEAEVARNAKDFFVQSQNQIKCEQ